MPSNRSEDEQNIFSATKKKRLALNEKPSINSNRMHNENVMFGELMVKQSEKKMLIKINLAHRSVPARYWTTTNYTFFSQRKLNRSAPQ